MPLSSEQKENIRKACRAYYDLGYTLSAALKAMRVDRLEDVRYICEVWREDQSAPV